MRTVWWVGAAGGVKPLPHLRLQQQEIGRVFRDTPAEYRYAVGWSLNWPGVTVLDTYVTRLLVPSLKVDPHFVDGFEDIDHAVAALTIRYSVEK